MPPRKLQEQVLSIPLTGGLQAKAAPRLVPPGQNLKAQDVVQVKSGEWRPRDGGLPLVTTGFTDADGFKIASHDGVVAQIPKLGEPSGTVSAPVYLYSEALALWSGVANANQLSPGSVRTRQRLLAAKAGSDLFSQDLEFPSVVYNSTHGVTLAAWEEEDGARIRWALLGTEFSPIASGATETITDGLNPRCVGTSGGYVAVIYTDGHSGSIKALRIDLNSSQPMTTATHSFSAHGGTSGEDESLDVLWVSTSLVLISYRSSVAGDLRVTEYNIGAGTSSTYSQAVGGSPDPTAWVFDGNSNSTHFLAYEVAGSVEFRTYTAGGTFGAANVLNAASSAQSMTGYTLNGSGDLRLFWDQGVSSGSPTIFVAAWESAAAGATSTFIRNASLQSHVFALDSEHYMFLHHSSAVGDAAKQDSNYLFVASGTAHAGPVALLNRWSADEPLASRDAGGSPKGMRLNRPSDYVGTECIWAADGKRRLLGETGQWTSASSVPSLVVLTPNPSAHGDPIEYDGQLYWPGGTLQTLSGRYAGEHDFLLYPPKVTALSSATAGSLVPTEVHSYVAVYAAVNGNGDVVRSAPSEPVSVTISGGHSSADVTVWNARIGARLTAAVGDTVIELYRTEDGGSTYYLTATVANGTAAHSQSVNDGRSDASLISQELLYTTGGILEAHTPPQCTDLAVYRERMWLIEAEDPTYMWYSLRKQPGQAFRFNEAQRIKLDDQTGEITALVVLNERLLVFKREAVYVLSGDGPNDVGRGGYAAPQQLPVDVGTATPSSVVATSIGVFFQETHSGDIHLIGNDLSHNYIGRPIEGEISGDVVAATVMREPRQVRFATGNGTYVYDLTHSTWVKYTNQSSRSACEVGDTWYYLDDTAGEVIEETAGVQDPVSIDVVPTVETSNLQLSGIGGFARLWEILVLGDCVGDCTVRVKLYYDAADTVATQTVTQGYSAGDVIKMHVYPERQQLSSIRIGIDLTYTGGQSSANGGARFSGLTLRYGRRAGVDKSIDIAANRSG